MWTGVTKPPMTSHVGHEYIPFSLLCPKATQTEVKVLLVAVETVGQDTQFTAVTRIPTGGRRREEGWRRREGGGRREEG